MRFRQGGRRRGGMNDNENGIEGGEEDDGGVDNLGLSKTTIQTDPERWEIILRAATSAPAVPLLARMCLLTTSQYCKTLNTLADNLDAFDPASLSFGDLSPFDTATSVHSANRLLFLVNWVERTVECEKIHCLLGC